MLCIILVLSNCVWSVCCTLDYWVSTERWLWDGGVHCITASTSWCRTHPCYERAVTSPAVSGCISVSHTLSTIVTCTTDTTQEEFVSHQIKIKTWLFDPLLRSFHLKHKRFWYCQCNKNVELKPNHPYQCSRARYWWNGNKSLSSLYQGYCCLWEENRICLIEAAENCKFID